MKVLIETVKKKNWNPTCPQYRPIKFLMISAIFAKNGVLLILG